MRRDLAVKCSVGALSATVLVFFLQSSDNPQISQVQERQNILEDTIKSIQKDMNIIMCGSSHVGRTGAFCLDPKQVFDGGNQEWDGPLCNAIEQLVGESSIGDFGAGLGHYGRCFLRIKENIIHSLNPEEQVYMTDKYILEMNLGNLTGKQQVVKSWQGLDGALNIAELSEGFVIQQDLTSDMDLGNQFDWVMSLEVGEHVPHEYEAKLLDNISKHACKGVILSWAVVGQGGHNHVNNQDNEHVVTQMATRGWTHDLNAQIRLRTTSHLYWFKNTIMVFRAADSKKCTNSL